MSRDVAGNAEGCAYDKCTLLEETVKQALFVLTRNCVIIFCRGHLSHFSCGCTKICRKLERNSFNYRLCVNSVLRQGPVVL
jgi:hypothetical protein